MIHKIQTGDTSFLTLEVLQQKSEVLLRIAKSTSILTFTQQQTTQLNLVVQSIDVGNYVLKEYGSIKK